MDVAVLIATFGDDRWARRAAVNAVPSAEREQPAELVTVHGDTLAGARNEAARRTSSPWLCFLDADDELEPGYLAAMAATELERGLLAPAVRFVETVDELPPAEVLGDDPRREIDKGWNPCVIGTLLRRDVFDRVGGFWPERAWEDWSLFRRAWLAGEQIHHVRDAVYRVHVDPAGRNSTVARPAELRRQILRSHTQWQRKALR